MWQTEQPGLPVSAQMKPLYIAREKAKGSKTYHDPIEILPIKILDKWRIKDYNNFMNNNMNKKIIELPWRGEKYTHFDPDYPDDPFIVTLYPFEPEKYPRFCISQNVDGQRHILSDDKQKLEQYLGWLRGIQSGLKGGNRKKRTKRNKRTKRTKRIHSIKRK